RQLAQRITARFHLDPLDAGETAAYLRHRWRVAGGERFPFDAKAVQRLHARSGGVPRLVNVIAERALLAGYARDAAGIDAKLVEAAADEVLPPPAGRGPRMLRIIAAAAAAMALAALGWWWHGRTPAAAPAVESAAAAPAAAAAAPVSLPAVATADDAALALAVADAGVSPVPAWQSLLAAWNLPASAITVDPSGPSTPTDPDVHCLQGRVPRLDALLALDRPLLLRLRTGDDAGAWALLLGADARRARLQLGGRVVDIDRMLLQAHWQGDYAGLWQGPAELSAQPKPGTSGASVDWLRQRLRLPAGAPYDSSLRDAVRALQDARGLPADGIAGPLTLMAL